MKKLTSTKGLTLLELVVVITLVGIISVPVIQSIISSVKANTFSKQKTEATILAQRMSDSIEVAGIAAEGLVLDGEVTKTINNNDYIVACKLKAGTTANEQISLGSTAPVWFEQHYQIEFWDTVSNNIVVKKYDNNVQDTTYGIGGELNYTYTEGGTSVKQFSLVFKNTGLEIYPFEKLAGTPVTIPEQFYTDPSASARNIKLVNKWSTPESNKIDLKIYNLCTSNPQAINIYYDMSAVGGFNQPNINLDKNVRLNNAVDTSSPDFSDDFAFRNTYVVTIKKKSTDTEPLVEREIIRISKTME